MKAQISILLIAALSLWSISCQKNTGRTEIVETEETIVTYPFSGPDPVPILTRSSLWGRGARLYPYTFFDEFSRSGVEKEWKVIRMRNPFVEVSILPQTGGKIWGAKDRGSGRDFIYTNHVLKFREIALRGPWTSGRIEFNFGIVGHYTIRSPSCGFLDSEKSGQKRQLYCRLYGPALKNAVAGRNQNPPPDKAYFETHAFWYNPTPLHQSYYAWMNGAVRTGMDLQYIFFRVNITSPIIFLNPCSPGRLIPAAWC